MKRKFLIASHGNLAKGKASSVPKKENSKSLI
jgi:mannose/fructose-specific phosphotransferase system component IIA